MSLQESADFLNLCPFLLWGSVRPTRFADKPFSRYSVNSMIFSLGKGGQRGRGREGGKNNFLLLERRWRQKRVSMLHELELSPLTCGATTNLVLLIQNSKLAIEYCAHPRCIQCHLVGCTRDKHNFWRQICESKLRGQCLINVQAVHNGSSSP